MPRFKFCEIVNNIRESRAPTPADEASYIGLEHLDSGSLFVSRWGSDVPLKGNKLQMKKGDLLFGKRNAYLRRAAIAPHDGLFSAHGMVFRPNVKVIDERLFPFFVGSDAVFDAAIRISVGSLSPTVNWRDLAELEFELPPLEVQPVIAEKLWAANETRESYKRLLSIIDNLVKSQFVEEFLPLASGAIKLKEVVEKDRPITYGIVKPGNYVDGGVPIIKVKDYPDEIVLTDDILLASPNIEKAYKRSRVKQGDLLYSIRGTVGRTAFVPSALNGANITQDTARLSIDTNRFNPSYVRFALAIPEVRQSVEQKIKGLAVRGVNLADLREVEIPDLSRNIQDRFAAFVASADKSKFAVRKSLEKLDAVYKALSKEAFG